jgi:hypothetical protein
MMRKLRTLYGITFRRVHAKVPPPLIAGIDFN